ncbi:uncharacterized protein BO72DRAFT_531812 [Aspergillus fijiensis CBS 313.89]|uniref:Uncharacterized protein n=1 Tax=Aspergillus fijiensis CBS 313.89 TaxID=1448319 RepID=A0A8G1RHI5_9EURO|nr:uncharacterized protein BO72DRAFT_531812 [Aspergillus fijiensis CBS 313.89]RAK72507.1 hypothetical protein BO72DRAFT_531812 [Aspergillus fijiensis CBS 313.89]
MPLSTANFTTTATHVIQSDHPISLPDPYMLGPFDHLYHFATPVNAVRLLDYYLHLTGRLRIDPATGVRSMTRLGTGIHLSEAHCDAPLRSFARSPSAPDTELSVFDFPNAGNPLLAPWDLTLEGAQRDPVLTIQPWDPPSPAPALPERTFGNTVVTPVIELDSTALTQAPLWQIAGLINDRIRHVSPAEVRQLGRWIAAQPDTSRIQLNFPVVAAAPFIATGWHRFPLYAGAEMDGVAPSLASPVFMDALFDGMVFFVEPKVRDGGVEAVASLRRSI